jgi:hypothetical protein
LEAWDQPLRSTWPLVITPWLSPPDLPREHAYTLEPGRPTPGWPTLLRPPIALDSGTGILTCFPSATLLSLALGADSPCADERCAGNLGLPANGLFTRFIATHVSIRTSDTSSRAHTPPSQAYGTLLYHPGIRGQGSGIRSNPTVREALQHLGNTSSYSLRSRCQAI